MSKGCRVRIRVKLTDPSGDVIEQSAVEYFQGAGTLMPGLEAIVEGLEPGAERSGVIPAAQAFGAVANLPTKHIPLAEFGEGGVPKEGATFAASSREGQPVHFKVLAVGRESVEVRFVHPLAGKDIGYELKILDVRDPSPPPLPPDAINIDSTD